MFQSTPPHGGRHRYLLIRSRACKFQSTPPHGGRPLQSNSAVPLKCVSIHAPARGATELSTGYPQVIHSFNPRPRTGGDACNCHLFDMLDCFNPRPRTGGDLMFVAFLFARLCFNPRPRTGGDSIRICIRILLLCFNPRPRTGGDISSSLGSTQANLFQSTPPHGGRLHDT